MKLAFIGVAGRPLSRFWDMGTQKTRLSSIAVSLFIAFMFLARFSAVSQAPPAPPQNQQPHGTVIFSRSTDETGQTTTTAGPAVTTPGGQAVTAPVATDAEREAVTFTAFDMEVHLRPAAQQISVRALVTVRNDSRSPLVHIPLEISSSLTWEQIRVAARDVAFTVATLNSDVDHTGQLHEAAIPLVAPLAQPLAPGASLQLDVTYSGAIPQSAQRLIAIGAPNDVALHTDWDSIGVDFTGLRGFGNVVWYPVSSVPVILGDGARAFDEMGEHKLRMAGAHFRLRLTDEFPHGQAPTVALINGYLVPLAVTQPATAGAEVPGIATASLDTPALGFEAPSLFLAIRTPKQAANTTLFTLPGDESAVEAGAPADRSSSAGLEGWASAAAFVTPFLQGWLGPAPRSQLTILDLPDPDDAPFETGALLVTAIRQATPDELDGVLAHALTHAFLCTSTSSPPAWLSEGVAHFMGTLWIEKQSGRRKALESLESGRTALALVEPSSPGESPGQPLAQAISPAYYRTKAAYVFWMLRDLAGDPALSAALRAYHPGDDARRGLGPSAGSDYFEKLVEQAGAPSDGSLSQGWKAGAPSDGSSSQGWKAGLRRDLSWFFSDWVEADKGLPDIAIDSVFPSATEGNNWLVAVNLSNSGYAAAEIPVTVSNPDTSVTQRVIVPARGKATLRILLQGRPTQVQANDGTVPETEASVHILNLVSTDSNSSPSQSGSEPQ
ncbi:MAG: hypothetical protein ABSC62_10290 [Terracidiphilus sp.]|jgi:hypothetical protein